MTAPIDDPYSLEPVQRESYARDGFVRLPAVFDAATRACFRPELSAKVAELTTLPRPMEERTTYQRAFLQVMNLWTRSEIARRFVFATRAARSAAERTAVQRVRHYRTQA